MKYRRFGKTELKLPILTYGAMQVGNPEDENVPAEVTRRAIEAGAGTELTLQDSMIFEHPDLKDWVRL